jgi:hypothetical protein
LKYDTYLKLPDDLDEDKLATLEHYLSCKDHLIYCLKIDNMGSHTIKKLLKMLDKPEINLDPLRELNFGEEKDFTDKLFILLGTVILHKMIKATEFNTFNWKEDIKSFFCMTSKEKSPHEGTYNDSFSPMGDSNDRCSSIENASDVPSAIENSKEQFDVETGRSFHISQGKRRVFLINKREFKRDAKKIIYSIYKYAGSKNKVSLHLEVPNKKEESDNSSQIRQETG